MCVRQGDYYLEGPLRAQTIKRLFPRKEEEKPGSGSCCQPNTTSPSGRAYWGTDRIPEHQEKLTKWKKIKCPKGVEN